MKHESQFFAVRGKTDRRRKQNGLQQRDKKLIAIYKHLSSLRKQKYNLGYEELEEPYQKGFVRLFVLRDDTKMNKLAPLFSIILKQINTFQYSETKAFKKRRRKNGKRIYVDREQTLKALDSYHYQKLPDACKVYFLRVESFHPMWKKMVEEYRFAEPWRFELEIRPYMITHRKKIDNKLESQIHRIENFLNRNYLQGKIDNLKGNSYSSWNDFPKEKYKLPSIYNLLNTINEY